MDFFQATDALKAIDAEIEANLVDDDGPPMPKDGVARALMGANSMQPRRQVTDPVALALVGHTDPAHGAFAPTAPRPGDPPPPAELRSYAPSPSEAAAFRGRQAGEFFGMPPSQAERFGQGVGAGAGLLTPVDDVSRAIGTGAAGDAALAGFSLIPGFKGGRKAAEAALPALRSEVDKLMGQYVGLGGRARPLPAGFEPAEKQVEGLNELKSWLTREIETVRAARPQSRSSVPITTSPQQREVTRFIDETPTIAFPGRQGFATKDEQRRLVQEHLQSGGQLTARPWGHTPHTAREDVKRLLAEAHGKGKRVSAEAAAAAQHAAAKAEEAAKELADLRLRASVAESRGESILSLRQRLDEAEKKAKFYEEQFNKVLKRLEGGD